MVGKRVVRDEVDGRRRWGMKYPMMTEGGTEGAPTAADDVASRAVELRLPPEPEYLRLARYAAADAATRAALGIDDTDDLRLAVSELCTLLTGSGTSIRLRFVARDGEVEVEGDGSPGPELSGANGELAQTLVEAVVDEYRFGVRDGRASFLIRKHRGR